MVGRPAGPLASSTPRALPSARGVSRLLRTELNWIDSEMEMDISVRSLRLAKR